MGSFANGVFKVLSGSVETQLSKSNIGALFYLREIPPTLQWSQSLTLIPIRMLLESRPLSKLKVGAQHARDQTFCLI